jgi:hypothetical protein
MYDPHETSSSDGEPEDVLCEIESITSETSVIRLTREQAVQMKKLTDPDYRSVRRQLGNKIRTIEMYSTNMTPGRRIRDPVSGIRLNERVGTMDEKRFFKIHMTSFGDGSETNVLFYSSPEAYERHQRTRMPFTEKAAWHQRHAQLNYSPAV